MGGVLKRQELKTERFRQYENTNVFFELLSMKTYSSSISIIIFYVAWDLLMLIKI